MHASGLRGNTTKTTFFWALLLIGLWFFQVKPYFHTGFPYTHDGENHLARFANYKIAIKEGQVPPRLAPNLLNRYGYPVFNFNYPLANIASLPFSALKLSYELTFKILAGVFVLGGITGCSVWVSYLTKTTSSRAMAVALYGLSPYLLSTILFRGNIGEIAAWGLLPWLFASIEYFRTQKFRDWQLIFPAALFGSFFLAHNVFALFGTGLVVVYALLRTHATRQAFVATKQLAFSLVFGGLLSLWFWLPALTEKRLIVLDDAQLSLAFLNHFPTLQQLVLSPLKFGFSVPGSIDSLSFHVGLGGLLVLSLGLVVSSRLIFRKLFQHKKVGSWIIPGLSVIVLLLLLFQLKTTTIVWEIVPFARFIQFPWRLGMLFGAVAAGLASVLLNQLPKKATYLLAGVLVFQAFSWNSLAPVDYFHKLNRDYDAFSQTTSTLNENLPGTFTYQDFADWQPTASILAGDGSVTISYWKGSDRQYQVDVNEISVIVEPTAYFAGWVTYATNLETRHETKISYINNPIIAGRIAYELEPGSYAIRTRFTQLTWPRIVGNTLSLVTALALGGNFVWGALASMTLLEKKKKVPHNND